MRFPWFFNKKITTPEDPVLKERVKALEERWNEIETEWNEWYEKFRLLHLRLAHRQKALERSESANSAQAEQANGGAAATVDAPLINSGGMNPSQVEWQQKILRRRARI